MGGYIFQSAESKRSISLTRGSARFRYIPAAGRFLIVCTFMEDAIRIITQWNDQLLYLKDYRHSKIPTFYSAFRNTFTMVVLIFCQYRGVSRIHFFS